MKLDDQHKKDLESLAFATVLLILFLLCFGVVIGQDMSYYEIESKKIELNLKPPKHKFKSENQINNKVLVFISGMTLTTIGVVQTNRYKNSTFRYTPPKGAIPINPHNTLIGLGLLTMSISFVIQ